MSQPVHRAVVAAARHQLQDAWLADVPPSDRERTRSAWARPLYVLLRRWASAGSSREAADFAAAYVDERARYRGAASDAVLDELLNIDMKAMASSAGRPERAQSVVSELRKQVTLPGPSSPPISLALLGDCLLTELRGFLRPLGRSHGLALRTPHHYFSASEGSELRLDGVVAQMRAEPPDIIAASFFTYEGLPLYGRMLQDCDALGEAELESRLSALMAQVESAIRSLRTVTNAPILLHSPCGLPLTKARRFLPLPALTRRHADLLERLRQRVADLAAVSENVILLDEREALGASSLRAASRSMLPIRLIRSSELHPSWFGAMAARQYLAPLRAFAALRHTKVLFVDFDDTLWTGVMAEGPVGHHLAFQQLLKELATAGVLLVAASKNDPASIRWDEMALDPADFVLHKITWGQKVDAIREAAAQLDLGMDSFVFLDDNPTERGLVAEHLPAVTVLDPHVNASWQALRWLLDFPATTTTDEAAGRTEMYREAARRRAALAAPADPAELLRSLGLTVSVGGLEPKDVERATDLLARTNQFNTTTRRLSRGELLALDEDPAWRVLTARMNDRHGNFGLVAIALVNLRGSTLVVDDFVMSCRAMGFGLETALVRVALDAVGGWKQARGLLIHTSRNSPAQSLFADCGFVLDDEPKSADGAGTQAWTLTGTAERPAIPNWLHVTVAPQLLAGGYR